MRRVGLSIMLACLLIAAGASSNSAKAGDYGNYGVSYYHRHSSSNVWYSSDCCYRKVVRHERSVHYERTYGDGYYRHHSYDGAPYRSGYYSAPSYRYGGYDRPYYGNSYRSRGYADGYGSYDCSEYSHRVKVHDEWGGWVWGRRTGCY